VRQKNFSDEELIELEARRVVEEKAREEEEKEGKPEKKFTAKGLKTLCGLSPQANYTLPTDRRCRRS
jgi:hypothetical protein